MRDSHLMKWSTLAAGLAVPLLATSATPQVIAGRTVDANTGEPVYGVEIVLVDTLDARLATVVSSMDGEFFIMVPSPGTYLLRANRLGYATVEARPMEIGDDEAVEVEVQLHVLPVELEPLTVVVRRRESLRERDLRGYYERIERYGRRHTGPIRIFTRRDLEQWYSSTLNTVLEYNAPYWYSFGQECSPKVFVDGRPGLRHPHRSVLGIEGIEFYRRYGPVSTRFWDPGLCGVVLVWTRPVREHVPFDFKQLLGAAAAIALLTFVLL
jgi:hypothetical protein